MEPWNQKSQIAQEYGPLPADARQQLMKIYVTQRSSTSCHVCKIPARTRIYITFNSTSPAAQTPLSFLSFTVSLCVCCPSSKFKAAKSKCIQLIFLIIECFFYCLSKFIPFYFFKIHYFCYSGNCQQNYFLRWFS